MWIVYGLPEAPNCAAMARGFAALGIRHKFLNHNPFRTEADVEPGTIDGVVAPGLRGAGAHISRVYQRLGVPVLVHDYGRLHRAGDRFGGRAAYWYLGLNDHHWLPTREQIGGFKSRFAALDIPLKTIAPAPDAHILIAGQTPGDKAHDMEAAALEELYARWAAQLQQATGRRVCFRPHPDASQMRVSQCVQVAPKAPLADALASGQVCALVSVNSTSGLEAMMHGLPALYHPEKPPYWAECGIPMPDKITLPLSRPSVDAVADLCERVAYSQWTLDEFASGEAISWITSLIPPSEKR